jgi:CelD/BcsL family acetyltransferase involved in cellulose biosynthesis
LADCLKVREATFEGLADRWERLLQACREATVFLTPTWQRVWWEQFGGGADLRLLEVTRESAHAGQAAGRAVTVAVAPLMSLDGVVSFLGGTDLVDYHDLIVGDADPVRVADAALRRVASWEDWHTLDLKSIPGDSPNLKALLEAARGLNWRAEDRVEDLAPGITLPASFDEYVASLDKKDRHELRRKLRRLHATGEITQEALASPADIGAAFDDFIALVRLSSPEKDLFLTAPRVEFVRSATVALAERDQARLFLMRLDGKRVAGSLCFKYGERYFGYNSGYDPASRALAVGLLNHAMCLERVIEGGAHYFDFMRGDEPYKYDLGAKDREIHHVVIRR